MVSLARPLLALPASCLLRGGGEALPARDGARLTRVAAANARRVRIGPDCGVGS